MAKAYGTSASGRSKATCLSKQLSQCLLGAFQDFGALFRSAYDKDHNVLGSVLGPPIFGNSLIGVVWRLMDLHRVEGLGLLAFGV